VSQTEPFQIVDFQPRHREAFRDLNLEWIEEYFQVEAMDLQQLGDPETHLLAPGGVILVAENSTDVLGVGALRPDGPGRFEVTKMAVSKTLRSRGVGRQVLTALIARAEALGASELYLICNTILAPAIHLYRSMGFSEIALPAAQKYERGNIAFQRSVNSPSFRE